MPQYVWSGNTQIKEEGQMVLVPDQFELFCNANIHRIVANQKRPTITIAEQQLLLTWVLKSPGSSLFSQMLLPPHNYVATSNNMFAIWANSTFYLKRRCWAKNWSLVLKWASNRSSCIDMKALLLLNTETGPWRFHNIIEFVHSIFTVIQFLKMEPQWIKLLPKMLRDFLICTTSICPLQHLKFY